MGSFCQIVLWIQVVWSFENVCSNKHTPSSTYRLHSQKKTCISMLHVSHCNSPLELWLFFVQHYTSIKTLHRETKETKQSLQFGPFIECNSSKAFGYLEFWRSSLISLGGHAWNNRRGFQGKRNDTIDRCLSLTFLPMSASWAGFCNGTFGNTNDNNQKQAEWSTQPTTGSKKSRTPWNWQTFSPLKIGGIPQKERIIFQPIKFLGPGC